VGFERESFDKLMKVVWGKKSQMQQAMSRDSKGEPFIIRELEFKGAQTPSQLATALKVTSGRMAALEKKGLIEREVDPNDRRIVHVNLTEQGRAKAKQQREDMRDAVCWVFSQMGERRTREFVDLTEEFATYVTICIPGQPRPTAEEVKQAFAKAESEDPA
jgi:MarR family 2-MHQ and catechol resistance regulon transcriptional repressor